MMETKTAPYDVVEFLEIPEEMAAYLEACIQESDGDTEFIPKPFRDITYTKWMPQIASDTGLPQDLCETPR